MRTDVRGHRMSNNRKVISMLRVLYLLLYIGAALCFAIAAFSSRRASANRASRVAVLPLGLLLWVLVPLIQSLVSLAGD